MASSLNIKALLGCLALTLGSTAVAQDADNRRETLVLESGPVTVDPATNLFHASHPKITQGNLSIEADEATGTSIDFSERSEWRFTGSVRIAVDTAVLEATSAVFTFEDGRLSYGELTGTPVRFSDFDKVRQTAIEGQAQQISYDAVVRKLRMTGDAWVQRGQTRVLGCDLNYDFAAAERDAGLVVTSASDECADRFRVLIERDRDEQPAPTDAPR
jgi:lipopolysaccharide transport protein LptA